MKAEYHWFAVYTKSRAEKKTYQSLIKNGIETYLPLQKKLSQWSDRKKWVEVPLFNSYIFVYISEIERDRVLQVPGVVKFVRFSGKDAIIREDQIEILKRILSSGEDLEISDHNFALGEKVKVTAGLLTGMTGELVQIRNAKVFIVRFDQLGKNGIINVPTVYLEPYF